MTPFQTQDSMRDALPTFTRTNHKCPICAGPVVPLRGQSRCTRCSFVICEGCDGVQTENEIEQ